MPTIPSLINYSNCWIDPTDSRKADVEWSVFWMDVDVRNKEIGIFKKKNIIFMKYSSNMVNCIN